MVYSVLLLSTCQGATEICLVLLSWSSIFVFSLSPLCAAPNVIQRASLGILLVLYIYLQFVFQSFFEVVGVSGKDCRWSGMCSLQGQINEIGVLEQPACRKFDCLLAREAEASGEGTRGFAWYGRSRECGVSVGWWSLISWSFWFICSICFRESLRW